MSQISVSAKGVETSGSVGGQKGSVGIDANGGVKLGIDVGIGKIGINTNYGGSLSVGFGGVEIQLGVEGVSFAVTAGKLFSIKFEKTKCSIVQSFYVGGDLIFQNIYDDPDCKKDPPLQPVNIVLPPVVYPPTPVNPKGLATEKTCKDDTMFVGDLHGNWNDKGELVDPYKPWDTKPIEEAIQSSLIQWRRANYNPNWSTGRYLRLFGVPFLHNNVPQGIYTNLDAADEGIAAYYGQFTVDGRIPGYTIGGAESFETGTMYTGNWYWGKNPEIVYGHGGRTGLWHRTVNMYHLYPQNTYLKCVSYKIKYKKKKYKGNDVRNFDFFYGSPFDIQIEIVDILSPPPCPGPPPTPELPSKPKLPPLAGNKPPMPESCCEALKADIEDIKEVLATKEMLGKKLKFPWRLRMPGGEGDEIITDYPNLARAIAQMIDHLGIHPPKLSIKDVNNAIAGNQGISNQFPSATQGFEALMAQVWDANADVDTLTNFLYRLSWLCVQQSMNLAKVSAEIQAIRDMIGGEIEPDEATITTPFNIGAGVEEKNERGKGFGKTNGGKINKSIDANTELSTEALLPDFLKIRENPIAINRFSGSKDVYDLLSIIVLKLEKL